MIKHRIKSAVTTPVLPTGYIRFNKNDNKSYVTTKTSEISEVYLIHFSLS